MKTPRVGLLASRNLGLASSKAQVIAFVDDDFVVGDTWGAALYELFKNKDVYLATGPALPLWEQGYPPPWAHLFEQSAGNGVTVNLVFSLLSQSSPGADIVDPTLVFGQNFIVRREVLENGPGFGPDLMPSGGWLFVGDGEFAVTADISSRGMGAVLDSRLAGLHEISRHRATLRGLVQRARYEAVVHAYIHFRAKNVLPDWLQLLTQSLKRWRRRGRSWVAFLYEAVWMVSVLLWMLAFSVNEDLRRWVTLSSYRDEWDPWY